MPIPLFQVDAFTDRVFGGNPAAVCLLDGWPEDRVLQGIAAENNLSETAFLVGKGGEYGLRWFTPAVEVDLCGHATLASGFVLFRFVEPDRDRLRFQTASGPLEVRRSADDLLALDFPSRRPEPCAGVPGLARALGAEPARVLRSRDLLAVFETEAEIRELRPDFARLSEFRDVLGVIVTAPGETVDFVSRFFAPNVGVLEDPVTGSAHCTLVPYWADRLGKSSLHARQLSARGGELFCEDRGERVEIAGRAVLYARGEVFL